MKLIQKYIIKEIFPIFMLGNFFFIFLLLLEKLVTLADLFFAKSVPLLVIAETILYFLPSLFVMTIPLASLLGVLIAFSRLSADSELIAMRATGASNFQLLKPVMFFGLFSFSLSFMMSGYLVNVGSTLAINNLNKIVENISIKDIQEKEMYMDIPGILMFVNNKIDEHNFKEIMVVNMKDKTMITSNIGKIVPTADKSIDMTFIDGRITATGSKGALTSIEFDSLNVNIPININIAQAVDSPITMNLFELYEKADTNKKIAYELSKRFATPFSAIFMSMFGFALGIFLSRSGKSFGVIISLAVAFLYNFLSLYFENTASTLSISPYFSAWIPNILIFFLLIYFLKRAFK